MTAADRPQVDLVTVIGLGLLLFPLTTMWHELGGHAAFCAVQGGHVAVIGAVYMHSTKLVGSAPILMRCVGVVVALAFAVVLGPSIR